MTHIAFPDAKHLVSASLHVGVLAPVKNDAAALASVGAWKTAWISVPVVTVKLDHQIGCGNKGVYAELSPDHKLAFVRRPERVEYKVPVPFKSVSFHGRLSYVHHPKHFRSLWVGVSACWGAVGGIGLLLAGRRPVKPSVTGFARIFVFHSGLPNVQAYDRTEACIGSAGDRIKGISACFARYTFAGPSGGLVGLCKAWVTTKLPTWLSAARNYETAPSACDRPYFVSEGSLHFDIMRECATTVKLNGVIEWPATTYTSCAA